MSLLLSVDLIYFTSSPPVLLPVPTFNELSHQFLKHIHLSFSEELF